MRVLISGGVGYIGSHTAKILAAVGFDVFVVDNLSTGHHWAVRWLTERPVLVRKRGRRPGDPPELVADATRAAALLRWRPRYSLDASIQTALSWEQANKLAATL